MAIKKQKGILLFKTRFRTSSLIAKFLTESGETVSVLFKGALASTGRRDSPAANLVPFAVLEIIYYEKETREVQTGKSVAIVEDFPQIRKDYETQVVAAKFVKTAIIPVKEGDRYPEIYDTIVALFRQWDDITRINQDLIWAGFLLSILNFSGFAPAIHHCAVCQGQLTETGLKFSPSAGGIVCGNCPAPEDSINITPKIKDALVFLLSNPFRRYGKLNLSAKESRLVREIMEKFWNYHIGKPPHK